MLPEPTVELGQRHVLVFGLVPRLDQLEHHVAAHHERRPAMVEIGPVLREELGSEECTEPLVGFGDVVDDVNQMEELSNRHGETPYPCRTCL